MKRRAKRIILTLLAATILISTFLILEVPRWRVNAYVGQLEKQGERLAVSDWLPTYPPSEQSSVQIFRDAADLSALNFFQLAEKMKSLLGNHA